MKTARTVTRDNVAEIRQAMAEIDGELARYENHPSPTWGHAGDLAHALTVLRNVQQFLTENQGV